ncbi:Hypothetical_protein [Hexamita inflata]|uniref:Hypothetical_protein n=1 Tax=Hexamita inflata TaxID=28002 RepID=A0AA86U8C0_9EUKA|nr:Hypothetical protein HINF_LOCUS32819 [Hexamita inflata]
MNQKLACHQQFHLQVLNKELDSESKSLLVTFQHEIGYNQKAMSTILHVIMAFDRHRPVGKAYQKPNIEFKYKTPFLDNTFHCQENSVCQQFVNQNEFLKIGGVIFIFLEYIQPNSFYFQSYIIEKLSLPRNEHLENVQYI